MLTEKYRPKTFDEVIGQNHVKKVVMEKIKEYKSGKIDEMVNFLFSGPPGSGKTTIAQIIARELFGEKWKVHFVDLNASDERGIDVIRTQVKFASKEKIPKIIFLDEADALTIDAQHALRRIMENKTKKSFFILACNDISKIIEPIQDRCVKLVFNKLSDNDLLNLLFNILKKENVKYEYNEKLLNALKLLIDYSDGSARRLLNNLEKMIISKNGEKYLTPDTIIRNIPKDITDSIFEFIKRDMLDEALEYLEKVYVENRFDAYFTIKRLYHSIKNNIDDKFVRAVAYRELAKVEETVLKYNCNPLIQFSRFIASLWLAKNKKVIK